MSFRINIKEIAYITNSYDFTRLELEFDGDDMNYSIMNSIRKVCINQIPIYGIPLEKIKILRNSSVFDGTELSNRLSMLPIKRLNHPIKFLPLKYYLDINFADIKYPRHPEDTIDVEYYLNVKNNGPEKIKYVSTDDLRITINNEIISNNEMYKGIEPITLVKLRPGEEFECSMKSALAVGELNSIFDASNCYYDEITENKYIFKIESFGQFNEYELLNRGIEIIIEKMRIIKENIQSEQYELVSLNNNSVKIILLNEDYTCGGPINYILQSMDKVTFSGITRLNFMEKNISFTLVVKKDFQPIEIFTEAIDKCIELYKHLKKNVEKLNSSAK